MNTLNENELHAISGGEIHPESMKYNAPTSAVDPWLQSFFDAQASAANQTLARTLTGGMAD
jgi:bacteriocin-like protein